MSKIKFGTGGFRAIIGEDFTKENIQEVCQAVAYIIKDKNLKRKVCIGYDNRFLSDEAGKWCAEVLAGNDIEAEIMDRPVTTPVIMYESMIQKNDFGIMITASHNPYLYNGMKIFVNGKDASKEQTNEIEQAIGKSLLQTVDFDKAVNKNIKVVSSYIDEFINYLVQNQKLENIAQGLNVVFDAKFGSSVEELQKLTKAMGIENYTIINAEHDAFFGFVPPAPTINNIEKARLTVLNNKADIGFVLDADGDRLAVIDEKGNYIDNNYILPLVYYYKVKYENETGDSVMNCCTSNLLKEVTEKCGYVCHEVPVGFKYVSSELIKTNSVVGGESSGGLAVNNHIWGKDSLLAISLCLKILKGLNKPFSEIIKELLFFANNYNKCIYDEAYIYTKDREQEIKNKIFDIANWPIDKSQIKEIYKNDYVKIFYNNNDWINVRFSGTEPLVRVFIESDNKTFAKNTFFELKKYLNI